MQNRVGPILKAVTFLAEPSAKDLHRAMEHFRLKDGAIDKTAPVDFLTPDDRTAVSRGGRFSVSLYKALLFLQVQSAIKSGTLNLEHSYKYRLLDLVRCLWRGYTREDFLSVFPPVTPSCQSQTAHTASGPPIPAGSARRSRVVSSSVPTVISATGATLPKFRVSLGLRP